MGKKLTSLYHMTAAVLVFVLALCYIAPDMAFATEDVNALQEKVEATGKDLVEAQNNYDAIQKKIDDDQKKIDVLNKQLPERRQQASSAVRNLYKMQQGSPNLMTLILSTSDFTDFLTMVTYLSSIQTKNTDVIKELLEAQTQLENAKADLETQKKDAGEKLKQAQAAAQAATQAREEAQKQADEELKRQQAEAQAAIEAAKAAQGQSQSKDFKTPGGNEAPVEVPSSDTPNNVDFSSGRDKFIAEWTPRIDHYLAGSPMAGTGKTFAAAAYDYGVDPRWSPAIATIESGKGAHCFRPHNAWGWGRSGWSTWDEAINAHVSGLARNYGYTLTPAAAKKYCPPNANFWYASVLAQMQKI